MLIVARHVDIRVAPSTDWPGGLLPRGPPEQDVSEKRNLNHALLIRLSDDLHARVDAAATTANQSAAAWARITLANELRARAPIDRRRSPRRGPRPDLSSSEAEMKAIVRQLGRTGGSLVLLCKSLREGHSTEHGNAELVLQDVRAVTEEVRALLRKIGL
jgi:hypothetical protein